MVLYLIIAPASRLCLFLLDFSLLNKVDLVLQLGGLICQLMIDNREINKQNCNGEAIPSRSKSSNWEFQPERVRTSVDPMLKDEKSSCRIASHLLALQPSLLLGSPCLSYWFVITPPPPPLPSSAIDLFKIANIYILVSF